MPTFTQDQQDQLRAVLGYASASSILTTELPQERSQPVIDRAIAILAELADIDQKLVEARADSMAKEVGQLKLSYSQHVRHLKSEGNRTLKELSNLLGIEVVYSKYGGSCSTMRSYW